MIVLLFKIDSSGLVVIFEVVDVGNVVKDCVEDDKFKSKIDVYFDKSGFDVLDVYFGKLCEFEKSKYWL